MNIDIRQVPLPDPWPPAPSCRHGVPSPIGAVRISKHGRSCVRKIKVRMDGPVGRRWINLARFWWLRHRGQIPPGKIVLHVDGDPMNDDPSNYAVGTNGDCIAIRHLDNPKWSQRQHRRCATACARCNRELARCRQLSELFPTLWYAVDRASRIVWLPPQRQRWQVYAPHMDAPPTTAPNLAAILSHLVGWPELAAMDATVMYALTTAGEPLETPALWMQVVATYRRYNINPPKLVLCPQ